MNIPDYVGAASLLRVIVDAGKFEDYGDQILSQLGLMSPVDYMIKETNLLIDEGMITEIQAKEFLTKWADERFFEHFPEKPTVSDFAPFDPEAIAVIYFIQKDVNGPIKIGISTDLKSRLATLQTACHEPLSVLGTMKGSYRFEAMLHQKFLKYRIRGEWFQPSEEITTYIADHCQKIEEARGDI
jgi:hypothetical protein